MYLSLIMIRARVIDILRKNLSMKIKDPNCLLVAMTAITHIMHPPNFKHVFSQRCSYL